MSEKIDTRTELLIECLDNFLWMSTPIAKAGMTLIRIAIHAVSFLLGFFLLMLFMTIAMVFNLIGAVFKVRFLSFEGARKAWDERNNVEDEL